MCYYETQKPFSSIFRGSRAFFFMEKYGKTCIKLKGNLVSDLSAWSLRVLPVYWGGGFFYMLSGFLAQFKNILHWFVGDTKLSRSNKISEET